MTHILAKPDTNIIIIIIIETPGDDAWYDDEYFAGQRRRGGEARRVESAGVDVHPFLRPEEYYAIFARDIANTVINDVRGVF